MPSGQWQRQVYEEEYKTYRFELPPTVQKKHPRLPYPSEEVLALCRKDPKATNDLLIRYLATKDKGLLAEIFAKVKNGTRLEKKQLVARTLDWLYEELPADIRQSCIDYCIAHPLPCGENGAWKRDERIGDATVTLWLCSGESGFTETIAVWGEAPGSEEKLKQAHWAFFKSYLPLWHIMLGQDSGGWAFPAHYYCHSIASVMVGQFEMWSTFLGQNLYGKYPWVKGFGYLPFYTETPCLGTLPLGDDSGERVMRGTTRAHCRVFAERFDDPHMRWLAHARGQGGGPAPDRPFFSFTEQWSPFEFHPQGKPMRPPWEGLPPERFFDGWGLVVMRSDWTENATYAAFKVGDVITNHTHNDIGHFYIYKHGDLAEDAGQYLDQRRPHQMGYTVLAVAHNVVTVRDSRDPFVPNDGGQRGVSHHFEASPSGLGRWIEKFDIYNTGEMLAYDPHPEYVYAAGDVTPAYQNSWTGRTDATTPADRDRVIRSRTKRLNRMTRAFLYIRPDCFAVFDRVDALSADFEKKWLLHTTHEPQIEGDTVRADRNDLIETFVGSNKAPMLINQLTGRQPAHEYRFHGRLYCRTLLPKAFKIDKVGGPGREFWVDGFNYNHAGMNRAHHMFYRQGKPPTPAEPGEPVVNPRPSRPRSFGGWRVEVSPAEPNREDLFLHIIQVGDSRALQRMVPVTYLEREGRVGFTMTAHEATYTVLFDRSGIGGHIAIERAGTIVVDRDLETRLRKNRQPVARAGEQNPNATER